MVLLLLFPFLGLAQHVAIKNNSFYIDGQKFFVKGIGYEPGATPGKLPWERTFDPIQLRFDIQRILAGGFNTIRSWAPFTAQELDILQQYDIKIIMGIWIDPNGNFSDTTFVDEAKRIVTEVLSYSKNYDNIIAYLIMNEPLPSTIANAGYKETVTLWKDLINIIHSQHPNRPVSISNSSNGTFISSKVFDFSAYNVYIYNPVTVNYLHGYRDYIEYLNHLNHFRSPLIITEYGLSVSPNGPGHWGYGGNSLTEQLEGDLHMFKSLVDGGATGSCVFNYSDGWWKGGNEFIHNDNAEEWFGLIEYTSLTDNFGQERQVWKAVKAFQSAIITQPRSSEIYTTNVPVEVFMNDTVEWVEIMIDNQLIFRRQVFSNYLADTLHFAIYDKKDATLVFNCYDADNNLVKSEEKSILITAKELVLPTIKISLINDNYWQKGYADVYYQVNSSHDFTSSSRLDYIYYPHVGFDYGQKFQINLPPDTYFNFTTHHAIDANVDVFTVGAAFNVTYNSFKKRIVNQLTLSRINDLTDTADVQLSNCIRIYPNPVKEFFSVYNTDNNLAMHFSYAIFDNIGKLVKKTENAEWSKPISINTLSRGIYYIRIIPSGLFLPITKKIVKI